MEGWLQHCPLLYDQARCIHPPFVECYAIQAFSIASNLDPKLMPKEQYQITMRKVCIIIQSLLSRRSNHHSSYTTRFSPETEAERCLQRNQRRTVRAALVRCEPSTPRRNPLTDELAGSSRRRAQPFLPNHCSSEHNRACLRGPLWSSNREAETHFVQAARWARTRNCSRSPNLAPNFNGRGPPPLSSRTAHWECPKQSPPLVPHIVLSEAMKGHWT